VENCADAFAVAATDDRARGQTFNVVDGPGERAWSFLGAYQRGAGQPGWRLPVPYRLALWGVRLGSALGLRRMARAPSILDPRRFEARLKPLRCEPHRLRGLLGWNAPFDHAECLRRTYGPPRDPDWG
jgi:UDP-glucose 4-epimerase